ncbi:MULTISPECIES: methylenetetrahydrofolate reductase [unclassified Nitratiruptor]|uniref:methylenetetrahydrofolate reductase n=1 Tax=unclassified Nitratiruptor TaxID=2624044 RepID=UPI001915632A|nr:MULTISPECIES: methylenetetrahydrofolate reductase [unclassified Nitratiruptor]BCD60625.1 5,10-methylenetetrahydrofolate reductase [Nitratiruptor sp. YY08-10]BCD64556.1 5,10-methylenetetrahydrofolate reductase [Nitratiruptor sp. YY08-14]
MFEALVEKLRNGRYISLETTPGHLPTVENIIQKIGQYHLHEKVDAFTTTDNPLAKLKYNAILAAIRLQTKFHKPVIATMSMRDRNKIALQSDLLGANDFDIRAILALTGDPAKISDQPNTKGCFEGDSTLLLDIIKCFNAGIDYAGKEFSIKPKKIYPFAVSNSYAKNSKTLQRKFAKKIEHGAIAIITQPVFDKENITLLLELFEETRSHFQNDKAKSQLILGLFPITKLKTAQFLASHVPGINVPRFWIDELYKAHKDGEKKEYEVGMALSRDLFETMLKMHPKVHIMTANRFEVAHEILT